MKVVDRFNTSKEPKGGPRKFTFEFSGAGLVSVLVVTVLGIVWVFILGVLVGRGMKPEAVVPQMAQIITPTPAPAQQEAKDPPSVLKAEDLQFPDTLQGRKPPETVTVDSGKKDAAQPGPQAQPPVPAPPVASLAGGGGPTSTLEKTPGPVPKGQVPTAPAQPDKKAVDPKTAPSAKDQKDAKKDPKDQKETKEKSYRVTYQLAAFDKKSQAEEEAEKLKKKGLSTSVEEAAVGGKPLYRVLARIKGTEAEIEQVLEKAKAKKPILRDKKSL
ncbi:hypothetical protein NNJEOMEG_02848 [Fundidesulfovibrio magnetotacticus]|uniref:SPOR domain-containing protein n=1 Tax=Fundidesulfovibrio magnetotacticus TaxID=2730080 RepID=A0A6V8LVN9_9BACT|nr:SPOR domain-containing protein [Fundidesulfovibrio magnetotacticus]GFK95000.1 hypothetical protein NNJEOMEG_02848 [Fundidesulfovibrio magnetotacticus]